MGTTNLLLRAASETLKRKSSVGSLSNPPTPFANSGGLFGMSASTSVLPTPHQTPPMTPLRGDDPLAISPLTPLTVPQPDQILPEFNKTVDIIRVQHLDAARAAVRNPEVLQALEAEIERDCDWLRGFLFAAQVSINSFSFGCECSDLTTVHPIGLT